MTTARILQGDTEPIIASVVDGVGGSISGATITTRIQRLSDNFFFDWDDDTFKAFGSVGTPDQALTEFPNQVALYRLDTAAHAEGFDTSEIDNVTANDVYLVSFTVTAPVGAVGPGPIEIKVDQWVKDTRDAAIAAKYLGAVYINSNKGTNGTDPEVNGAPGLPVKLLADALSISTARGTRELVIVTGLFLLTDTLDEFLVTLRNESELRFESQDVNGTEFSGGVLKGIMSGRIEIRGSLIEDVSGFNGRLEDVEFKGNTALAAAARVIAHRCDSGEPGADAPTITFSGDGVTQVALRGWHGGVIIEGMVDGDRLTIETSAGAPVIAASCEEGADIQIRGTGEPISNLAGITIDDTGYNNVDAIWSYDLSANFDGVTDRALAGGAMRWMRMLSTNRQEMSFGPDRQNVYDDAGAVIVSFAGLSDGDGGILRVLVGSPARRSVFS